MTDQVRQAAERLVTAFARGDRETCFDCCAADATFVHTTGS